MKKTFIPYLLFLILLILGIYRLDHLAEEYSNEPQVIAVTLSEVTGIGQSFWEYQNEEIQTADDQMVFKTDSMYIRAVNAYENRFWTDAENYFSTLLNKYGNQPILLNYFGLTLYKSGSYDRAAMVYEQAIQKDNTYTPAHINLGIVKAKQQKYVQSEKAYQKAIELEPNNPKSYLNMGILLIRQERWQEAIPYLRQSVRLSSGALKSRSQYYAGLAFAAKSDTIRAKEYFNEAILLRPDYLLPRIQLGLLEKENENKKRYLEEVLRLNPNYAPAYYYLSLIYSEEKNLGQAEDNLFKAIKSNPSDQHLQASLGELYLQMNRIEDAERIFTSMNESRDLLPQNYFYMAKVESEKGNFEESLKLYDYAIDAAEGRYPEAHLNKGIIFQRLGQKNNAASTYQKAIRLRPDYSEAHYNLGLLFHRDQEYQQALDNYRNAVIADSTFARAWYNAGVVFKAIDKQDSAKYYFEQALFQEPDYIKAMLNLGVIYSDLEQYDKAIDYYRRLLGIYPSYTPALFNLGLAYRKNNEDKKAIDAYEELLNYDPGNISARKNLGVLYGNNGDHELAIQLYEDGIDMAAHDAELRFNLAIQYTETENYFDAITQLNKAIQLDQDYVKAYEKLMEITLEEGSAKDYLTARSLYHERYITNPDSAYNLARDWHREDIYSQAIEWYKKAIDFGKDDDWIFYWMARAYHESDDFENARLTYFKALDKDPGHKFAHLRLAEIFEMTGNNSKAYFHYKKVIEIDPGYDRIDQINTKLSILKQQES